jgi:hypothetical protein
VEVPLPKTEYMYFPLFLCILLLIAVCTLSSSCVLPGINTCTSHSHIFLSSSRLFYHFSSTSCGTSMCTSKSHWPSFIILANDFIIFATLSGDLALPKFEPSYVLHVDTMCTSHRHFSIAFLYFLNLNVALLKISFMYFLGIQFFFAKISLRTLMVLSCVHFIIIVT